MANHHRGLWGYSGATPRGRELTIQATGIGGASAAVVLAELARHGVRRAIRIGTCTAIDGGPAPGALAIATAAIPAEGASRSLGASGRTEPDGELHRRLTGAAGARAVPLVVASLDVVSAAPGLAGWDRSQADGAAVAEMGTATLFALGARLEVAVASALIVTGTRAAPDALDDEALEQGSLALAELALDALGG